MDQGWHSVSFFVASKTFPGGRCAAGEHGLPLFLDQLQRLCFQSDFAQRRQKVEVEIGEQRQTVS